MKQNIFMCIDLKSFFASVECADRGLDPFTTNLVVSDPSRGNGAICLAITPAMKALGIRNRCRIFEIPPGVQYITAMPAKGTVIAAAIVRAATFFQTFFILCFFLSMFILRNHAAKAASIHKARRFASLPIYRKSMRHEFFFAII